MLKILIGYDGSACAEAALDDLRRAGLPARGVEALALSVAEVYMLPPPPSSYEIVEAATAEDAREADRLKYAGNVRAFEEAQGFARRAGERLRENFPEWEVKTEAVSGSPAWELIVRADTWKPDLIVVGSHGRSALGRFVLGSVSQRALTEARCSVRVARGRVEVEPEAPARVVVGVDGSEGSDAAVRAVAARDWPAQSEARVLIVHDPLVPSLVGRIIPPVAKWTKQVNEAETEWLRQTAESATQKLSDAGLVVSSAVVEGDPKRLLVEEAARWGADCLFVGSTGFSNRIERFLLGSVSSAVAARAHCSVEVVRERKPE
ncbi:MAG TPA: universal stress protein [Pyrinomonadaceae bacterium]|nr:universal stress protein [Pyrinomonadaceae bacterium]